MKIKDYKCKCGNNDFFFVNKGNQKGIYCSYCGKWFKWADKDEQNLAMKQENTLEKIRAEIDKIYERKGNSVDCLNALDELKWFIDKYKGESEDV